MAEPASVPRITNNTSSAKVMADAIAAFPSDWATLSSDGRKARYGMAYIRSICAQAGVTLHEPLSDEDVLAVDCDINFEKALSAFR